MANEELLMVKFTTLEYMKQNSREMEKVKLLQSKVDEMTVKRSKELEAPLVSRMSADKENIGGINKLINEDA